MTTATLPPTARPPPAGTALVTAISTPIKECQ